MASLIGMEEERAGEPIYRIQLPEHRDDERKVYRLGERPGDDLVGRGVLDGGEIASLPAVRPIVEIAYVIKQIYFLPF